MNTIPDTAFSIIIGSMKCGTSSLYGQLSKLEGICRCINKEPEFFSSTTLKTRNEIRNAYEKLWDFDSRIHCVALEASTGYTKWPQIKNVPKKIKLAGVEPKIIYMVRNPYERIASHYFHNRKNEKLIGSIEKRLDYYIDVSNYNAQLFEYEKELPNAAMLVIDFDDFKENPEKIVKRCASFLGIEVPPNHSVTIDSTQNKTYYYSSSQIAIEENKILSKISESIPKKLKAPLKKVFIRPYSNDQVIGKKNKKIIHKKLKKDMLELSRKHNINVSNWGFH